MSRLRVAQWATGNIGTRSLQGIIDHPDLELAGVWVHAADKVGRDAGDLCDRPATGILATGNLAEIVALRADCVMYSPSALVPDEICALLAAGSNVVTTRGELHHPPSMDAALRDRVEEACAIGATSVHSTGSSPGFITEAVPLVLASIQRRLDRILTRRHGGGPANDRDGSPLRSSSAQFPLKLVRHRASRAWLGSASDRMADRVEGDAPLDVELRFPFGMEEMAARSPGYTANRAVNVVPYVCGAAPGIVTSVDLPQVIARLG